MRVRRAEADTHTRVTRVGLLTVFVRADPARIANEDADSMFTGGVWSESESLVVESRNGRRTAAPVRVTAALRDIVAPWTFAPVIVMYEYAMIVPTMSVASSSSA